MRGKAFGLREKPGFLERTERGVSGEERDKLGRRVRFVECCASEIHGFLGPEQDHFTSCSEAGGNTENAILGHTTVQLLLSYPVLQEHRTPTHTSTHTHLSKQV